MEVQNSDFYKGIGYYKRIVKRIKDVNCNYSILWDKKRELEKEYEILKYENEELKEKYEELLKKYDELEKKSKQEYDNLLNNSYKKFCSI